MSIITGISKDIVVVALAIGGAIFNYSSSQTKLEEQGAYLKETVKEIKEDIKSVKEEVSKNREETIRNTQEIKDMHRESRPTKTR